MKSFKLNTNTLGKYDHEMDILLLINWFLITLYNVHVHYTVYTVQYTYKGFKFQPTKLKLDKNNFQFTVSFYYTLRLELIH